MSLVATFLTALNIEILLGRSQLMIGARFNTSGDHMATAITDRFTLDYSALEASPECHSLAEVLRDYDCLDSTRAFNAFCRLACEAWNREQEGESAVMTKFVDLLHQLNSAETGEHLIRTSWGGVVVQRHQPPWVEKYLVIKQGGYLALEKHSRKTEQLDVCEGRGLLLYRQQGSDALKLVRLEQGDSHRFESGMEHCVIGTEDLLIFETSSDPLGMDQDLIFIFEPS